MSIILLEAMIKSIAMSMVPISVSSSLKNETDRYEHGSHFCVKLIKK
jgi:hypothetical protein